MRRRIRQPSRSGFTIVELMVAMALIVFIMYILAEAFSAGAKTFRDLKAIGDMNARLRTATGVLRRYLVADHFEGRKRLSDPSFWDDGPPKQGFFRIWQDAAGSFDDEGEDLDTEAASGTLPKVDNRSFRTTSHHLHFSVRLRGSQRGDYFSATLPAGSQLLVSNKLSPKDSRFQDGTNQYSSNWAEVAVYLQPTGEKTEDPDNPTATGLPLHALYLRQRLLVPNHDDIITGGATAPSATDPGIAQNHSEVSVTRDNPQNTSAAATMYFNSPADITMPIRRFGTKYWKTAPTTGTPPDLPTKAGARSPGKKLNYKDGVNPLVPFDPYPILEDGENRGSDVLLTDVISFDVRVLLDAASYGNDSAGKPLPVRFVSLHDPIVDPYWMQTAGGVSRNTDLAKIVPANVSDKFRVFDTWSSRKDDVYNYSGWDPGVDVDTGDDYTIPMYRNKSTAAGKIRIRAIQIVLRIWDSRTRQSRQVSLIQDM